MDVVVVPQKRKAAVAAITDNNDHPSSQDAIDCICGIDYDDGFSIACDHCSRWCHAACFRIVHGHVPDVWKCWRCDPRPVDKDAAERLQRAQLQRQREREDSNRRRTSPGVDRKHRRLPAAVHPNINSSNGNGNSNSNYNTQKRRRRPSVAHEDDSVVDIDEPSTHAYVPISNDIIHPDARATLIRHAHHWRGVTALTPSPSPHIDSDPTVPVCLPPDHHPPPPPTIKQLSPSSLAHPSLSLFTNPAIRPPTYAVHTSVPIPSHHLITPYTSSITPSASYLADPLNAYAHLGMPKPFVHLVGPPLDLALDARITGDKSRFVRSGCRPNAVLRPVLCSRDSANTSLSFGVFALRDLKANEEVVLGWEWDDGNAVHSLPTLIQAPYTFPSFPSIHPSSSHQIQHLRHQMSNILHALSSTFTTCACGSKAKDCAVNQMAAFVDGDVTRLLPPDKPVDLGPLIGTSRGFRTKERVPFSSGMAGVEMCCNDDKQAPADPLPHFVVEPTSPSPRKGKGKQRADDLLTDKDDTFATRSMPPTTPPVDSFMPSIHLHPISSTPSTSDIERPRPEPDPPDSEDNMPPKMRKRWIHRKAALRKKTSMPTFEQTRPSNSPSSSVISLGSGGEQFALDVETGVGLGIRIDEGQNDSRRVRIDVRDMPPSQVLSHDRDHDLDHLKAFDGPSPSASFAKLSIVSPAARTSPPRVWLPLWRGDRQNNTYAKPADDDDKMDVDVVSPKQMLHPPLSPHSYSLTSQNSPRSPQSFGSSRIHPSPTSTAMTTPPSPRESRLPDVPIPLSKSDSTMEGNSKSVTPVPINSETSPTPRHVSLLSDREGDVTTGRTDIDLPLPRPGPSVSSTHTPASPSSVPLTLTPAHPASPKHSPPVHTPPPASSPPIQFPTPPPPPALPPPTQTSPPPSPSASHALPHPSCQPKVKLSLKDFAARKRRQREEEHAGTSLSVTKDTSAEVSPTVTDDRHLGLSGSDIEKEKHTVAPNKIAHRVDVQPLPRFILPLSPSLPVKLRSEMGNASKERNDTEDGFDESARLERFLQIEKENEDKERSKKQQKDMQDRGDVEKKALETIGQQDLGVSVQTKQELVEEQLPIAPPFEAGSQSHLSLPQPPPPTPPLSDFSAHSRVSSQEDGEIPSVSLPPKPVPWAPKAPKAMTYRRSAPPPPSGPHALTKSQTPLTPSTGLNKPPPASIPVKPPPPVGAPTHPRILRQMWGVGGGSNTPGGESKSSVPPPPNTSPPPQPPPPSSSSSTSPLPSTSTGYTALPTIHITSSFSSYMSSPPRTNPRPIPQAPRAHGNIRGGPSGPASSTMTGSNPGSGSSPSSSAPSAAGPAGLPSRPAVGIGMGVGMNMQLGTPMSASMATALPKRPMPNPHRYDRQRDRDERDREHRERDREREYRDRLYSQRVSRARGGASWAR